MRRAGAILLAVGVLLPVIPALQPAPARAQTPPLPTVPTTVPTPPTNAGMQVPLNVTTTQVTQTQEQKASMPDNIAAWNAAAPTDQAAVMKVMNESTTNPTQAKKDAKNLTPTQQALMKPTSSKTKLTIKPVPPPPGTNAPASASEGSGYIGSGCWNIWINDSQKFWVWTIASFHLEVDNVCIVYNLYGYWVIYTTPYGWSTHNQNAIFYLWCGIGFSDDYWIDGDTWLAWGTQREGDWIATPLFPNYQCANPLERQDHAGIWIYAGLPGIYNPPLVVNTSQNWSGP